jgi:hypothetical protein
MPPLRARATQTLSHRGEPMLPRRRAPDDPTTRAKYAHSARAPFARHDSRAIWSAARRCTPALRWAVLLTTTDPRGCRGEPCGVTYRACYALLSRVVHNAVERDDAAGPLRRRVASECRHVWPWLDDSKARWLGKAGGGQAPAHAGRVRCGHQRTQRTYKAGVGGVAG